MNGREDDYNWVGPYMHSRQMVAVRSDSEIESLSDLDGESVAVQSSTKPESLFLDADPDDTTIPDVKDVYCMEDMNEVFSALQADYVDAVAGHETALTQYMDTTPGEYRLLDDVLLSTDIGIAFGVDMNYDKSVKLSTAIDQMRADGTLSRILADYGIEEGGENA
jgi:polar amino acid transport system substrate-binding protein